MILKLIIVLIATVAFRQPSDSSYTEKSAMDVYAIQPERALQIIDSAEIVGNMTPLRADLFRAFIYSRTGEEMNYDSAILIGERLMLHDSVVENDDLQEDVLEILLNACRLQKDYEPALQWATRLGELYRSCNEETEALRIDAEIGTLLVRIGQQEEGVAKIDSVISQLDGKRKFNELDALIIALKRKGEILNELGWCNEVPLTVQHMLDLLNDYEHHPADYHDGTLREPEEENIPDYVDFYRGKGYAYLASAYASLNEKEKASAYLTLYEQTAAGQNLAGRFMITSTLIELGEYDRVLDIFDEVVQQMDADTMNANYAIILRGRAEAAKAQGRYADASGYWRRYVELSLLLNEQLLQSKAHLYAARFHAQEQQHEIERHREATRRAMQSRTMFGLIGLLMLFFALYAFIQWSKTKRRNRILV